MTPRLAYHVLLYLQVLIDEIGAIMQIGHDTAHVCCCQHDSIGTLLIKEPTHGSTIQQVEFGMCATNKIRETTFLKILPNSRANESTMARYVYF